MDTQDVSAFLRAIKGDEYELPLFVALFTGLRQGELLGLTWDCVDFEKGTLLINKQHNRAKGEKEFHFSPLKNSRPRCLTAASAVMDALKEQQRRQAQWATELGSAWDNSENLVFTTQMGTLYQQQNYLDEFQTNRNGAWNAGTSVPRSAAHLFNQQPAGR